MDWKRDISWISAAAAAARRLTEIVDILQVLNDTSLWWFNQTHHIAPNAIIAVPDKNVTIAKKCSVFPVEFVGKFYAPDFND